MKARKSSLGRMLSEDRGAMMLILKAKNKHDKRMYDKGEISIGTPCRLSDYIPDMIEFKGSWQEKSWNYIQDCYKKCNRALILSKL